MPGRRPGPTPQRRTADNRESRARVGSDRDHRDIATTQTDIAERIHGFGADGEIKVEAASRYEVMCALNPDIEPEPFERLWERLSDPLASYRGGGIRVRADSVKVVDLLAGQVFGQTSIDFDELRAGHPSIVGLSEAPGSDLGHAYVLYGAAYTIRERNFWDKLAGAVDISDSGGNAVKLELDRYELRTVHLVDPYGGEMVTLDAEEFEMRCWLALSRAQARSILDTEAEVLTLETEQDR